MSTVTLKQHDTEGVFVDTLKIDGIVVDLTGCTVNFLLRKPGLSIRQVASIVAPATGGNVRYQPVAEDVEVTGKYQQEWEVGFTDGKILTFPNNDWNTVVIKDDLDTA